jgi:hypothetical protein
VAADRSDPARRDEREITQVGNADGAKVLVFPGRGARGDGEPGRRLPGETRGTGGDAGERDGDEQQPTVTVVLPDDPPPLPAPAAAALLRLLRRAHSRRGAAGGVTHLRPAPARTDHDDTDDHDGIERRAA